MPALSSDIIPSTLSLPAIQSLPPYSFLHFTELEIEAPSKVPSILELVSDRIRNQVQAAWSQAHFLNLLLKYHHLLSAHCILSHRSAAEYFGVLSKGDLLPAVSSRKERRGRELNHLSRPHNYKWPRPAFPLEPQPALSPLHARTPGIFMGYFSWQPYKKMTISSTFQEAHPWGRVPMNVIIWCLGRFHLDLLCKPRSRKEEGGGICLLFLSHFMWKHASHETT